MGRVRRDFTVKGISMSNGSDPRKYLSALLGEKRREIKPIRLPGLNPIKTIGLARQGPGYNMG
jgi:hypothetical protein